MAFKNRPLYKPVDKKCDLRAKHYSEAGLCAPYLKEKGYSVEFCISQKCPLVQSRLFKKPKKGK